MYPNQPAGTYPAQPAAPMPYPPQPYPGQPAPVAPYPPQPAAYPPAQPTYPPQPPAQPAAPSIAPMSGTLAPPVSSTDPNLVRPSLVDIQGRLLICRATRREEGVPSSFPGQQPGPRLTVDIIVLDGAPFPYGGDPTQGKPHTHHSGNMPMIIPGMFIRQGVLVDQIGPTLMGGALVVGRLGKVPSTKGNPAWKIMDPTPADMAMAQQYVASVAHAAPQAPMAPAPAPVPSAPPAAPAGPYAPQPYPQPMAAPAPAMPQVAPYMPPAPPPSAPPSPGLAAHAYPPPNYDPATWATYPPEVQMGIWGQIQAAAQPAPPAAPGYAPGQPYPYPGQ